MCLVLQRERHDWNDHSEHELILMSSVSSDGKTVDEDSAHHEDGIRDNKHDEGLRGPKVEEPWLFVALELREHCSSPYGVGLIDLV